MYVKRFRKDELTEKEYKNKMRIARKSHLKIKYNLTIEDYNSLLIKQEAKCAGCFIHQSLLNRALAIDHGHNTGKIRGLLCHNCNRGLGMLKDSEDILQSLINYLRGDK